MNKVLFVLLILAATLLCFIVTGCGSNDSSPNADIAALQRQLQQQKRLFATLEATIVSLSGLVELLEGQVLHLGRSSGAIEADLETLQEQLYSLEVSQTALQLQHISLLGQLAELQGYMHIVGFVDPCGDAPGVLDEVLLRLSNGQILASVSDNGNAMRVRFGLLSNGNYNSTDGTSCSFQVQNGIVMW